MDLDTNKTYDYHTAFDIQPTKVVYNVDLYMNRKKILNIAPDRSRNNSAATVRMVKNVESLISKSLYEEIFDQVSDISDVKLLKIVQKVSGVVISGFVGMSFPEDKLSSDYQTDAGITLHRPCIITLTKPYTLNSNFTVACVIYYENTSNFLFKITQAISSLTAQFIVINNTMQIRAGGQTRVTIPNAFHQKKLSFGWLKLDQLIKWPFQTILGPLQLHGQCLVIFQIKPH